MIDAGNGASGGKCVEAFEICATTIAAVEFSKEDITGTMTLLQIGQ